MTPTPVFATLIPKRSIVKPAIDGDNMLKLMSWLEDVGKQDPFVGFGEVEKIVGSSKSIALSTYHMSMHIIISWSINVAKH